ncbi:probable S-adenosylmethionine carrier 2, chloroplastic [Spinacia oleracea]|uniref:Probable S-adenosylmethionine carrier 2, chloroplastic n=1 Tax=Spinacia oleracea TaxID=3562 RepID=A0A9R0J867_SPIOL|nr:probable S-adenosylmethionine carrier 2, chloroplastic [Spinacia oleracea]XP_056687083.1 probable S-adenosylmethionine carrier 2, chloroplastic [Spinacia oleracea]XP_056687084.1 probable S-adenosylmethionine carrier 2, chloroplastic [Spinacia oleracea]XP_056687085.1 probable S-adenosylmethionine carrier 2, chloroplastic [Spinacia oleracea]XP_056687086.1 probable S-adenosylmethionine carrier 2, chloroplastic [Spinacia oleracea]XP_056687087.1 probable S-adenosylmethionine carrier 2, chloropla
MEELLKNPVFASHILAASGSVAVGTALSYPLDTIKTLIQVGASSNKKLTAAQVLGRVRSVSGYPGLYSGLSWLTVGRITSLGTRFGVYEFLTAFYKDGRIDNYVYVSEALLSGMIAGALESCLTSPFEMIKLRKQVAAAIHVPSSSNSVVKSAVAPMTSRLLPGYIRNEVAFDRTVNLLSVFSSKNHNMAEALKNYPWMMTGSGKPPDVTDVRRPQDIVRLEGWRSLWRGLRIGILRDSIFGGIFFGSWQFLHLAMLDWKAVGMDAPPETNDEIGPLSPLLVSMAAGCSGSMAAAASHGFDTSRTRSQCVVLPKYLSMERRSLKWSCPGNWFERLSGMHPSDRNLLFRGMSARMARSGLASFALVGTYYMAVDRFIAKS